jgi:transposase-like protein
MTKSKTDGPRPNPEVPERAKRRRFSAEYKLRVLQEADRCGSGEVGALLRREGLYSSHLTVWRQQRNEGALSSLSKKRGRKAKRSAEQIELDRVVQENGRLRERLRQLELIVAAQKKVAALEQALEEDKDG